MLPLGLANAMLSVGDRVNNAVAAHIINTPFHKHIPPKHWIVPLFRGIDFWYEKDRNRAAV